MFDLTPRPRTTTSCAKEENARHRDDWHGVGNIGGGPEHGIYGGETASQRIARRAKEKAA